MPTNKANSVKLAAAGYAYPLYEQGWNLFAPAPTSNYRFSYRRKTGKEWSDWIYPLDEYHSNHDKYPFAVSGRHTLAEYNLIYWIHSQLYQDYGPAYISSLKTFDEKKDFRETFGYKSYEQYVKFYVKEQSWDGLEGRLEITEIGDGYVHEIILPEVYAGE